MYCWLSPFWSSSPAGGLTGKSKVSMRKSISSTNKKPSTGYNSHHQLNLCPMKKFSLIFFYLVATLMHAQNVGINTDIPAATLHVEGGSDPEIALFRRQDTTLNMKLSAGSNELRLGLSASRGMIGTANPLNLAFRTNNTDRMTIDGSSGDVGIGLQDPGFRLDVLSNSPYPTIARFARQDPLARIDISNGLNALQLGVSGTSSVIGTTSYDDLHFQLAGVTRMVIKPSGKIGIGLPDPDHQLYVKSLDKNVAMFQSSVDSSVVRTGTYNSFLALGVKNGGHGYIGTETANDFALRTNGINRLYIKNANGFVGIRTNDPIHPLDVSLTGSGTIGRFSSTGTVANLLVQNNSDYTMLGSQSGLSYVGTASAIPFAFMVNGTMRMYLNTSGQVSIGTNNPAVKFHVYDPTPNQTIGLFQGMGGYTQIYVKNDVITTDLGADQEKGYVGSNSFSDFAVRAGGSTLIYLKYSTSRVGIGTMTPSKKLDVNGDAKVNGELTVNSIAQPGTTGVSFNANFSNYGVGYENVTYYKDTEGRVHLSGLVAINGTQSGTMFTLPAGYRPTGQLIFLVMSGSGPARIDVMMNGNVSIATAVPGWISTNGISFRAGN